MGRLRQVTGMGARPPLALWDEPNARLRCLTLTLMRSHKRCWLIQTAGRWPWKSEPAKECVTTHLLNQLALKMDGAGVSDLYWAVGAQGLHTPLEVFRPWWVGGPWWWALKPRVWAWVKPPLVQILVVVANIQMRTLKTEVEKGSMWTAVEHGSVCPKRSRNPIQNAGVRQALWNVNLQSIERESGYYSSNLDTEVGPSGGQERQCKWTRRCWRESWEEFSFLHEGPDFPGMGSPHERDVGNTKHHASRSVWFAPVGPWKSWGGCATLMPGRTDICSRSPRWTASSR